MKLEMTFQEQDKRFGLDFGEVQDMTDGGYERGYAAGYKVGYSEGFIPTQEKTVEITENGVAEVAPDDGYALSKVVASVSVGSDVDAMLNGTLKKIDSNIISLRQYACYGASSLQTVNLPNVTSIPDQAFRACTQLVQLNEPKATTLGSYTLYTCGKLAKADFSALTYINAQAFGYCSVLEALILRSATVATLANTNAFSNTPIAKGTGFVYVPAALVEQYKKAAQWSTYAAQIRAIEDFPEITT